MDVQLYVYDLTRGMARAMSQQFLGTQIDAVYHTSLVFGNIEYFFGMGVQTCYPGSTHHGRPMEVVQMGTTHLPLETILQYLESLKEVYSPESYDLFAHNCNNFTNDFAMFLVGKGIPEHITNLPKRVLDTPFGQMLKPQLDAGMRSVTQAPVPPQNVPRPASTNGAGGDNVQARNTPSGITTNGMAPTTSAAYGSVLNVTSLSVLEKHLQNASATVATIFFTSSTCGPCKVAYPMFDQLAGQYPQSLFIKVDINSARDVAANYQIRATPTFMTFSKGTKRDEWTGADPNLLKANVESAIQQAFPPHPHTLVKAPTLQFGSLKSVTYAKVPPLDKLMAKLGEAANDTELVALRSFIEKRNIQPQDAKLPDLKAVGNTFQSKITSLPVEVRFAAVDLLRCAMLDTRVSGFFAEEQEVKTLSTLIRHVIDLEACPHNLRLVTIHLACNLFTSSLCVKEMMVPGNTLATLLIQLITSSLLDASHPTSRVASASLAFDISVANYRMRREESREGLSESEQVELAAGLVETLSGEDNADVTTALLLALGYLVYCAPQDGELMDMIKALDAKDTVSACKTKGSLKKEVAGLL
ncbi:hypothetical protein LTR37_003038 [Vermiconidia calcicola]|uniref:Uncharacterized protein n=1 Tax=Vermiconidia calcicola TaxID=1690605 RepID=A0ACC3NQQ8_9PEZI|nr:hypothetical protein LTR37_003038 [Vermiconidia calcicola]